MQDWSDNGLDMLLENALQSLPVTPQQKRRAWERLVVKATMQSAHAARVAPAPCAPPTYHASKPTLRHRFATLNRALDSAVSWLFDDTRYDRALRQRSFRVTAGWHEGRLLGVAI
jgi:hypothetical protein